MSYRIQKILLVPVLLMAAQVHVSARGSTGDLPGQESSSSQVIAPQTGSQNRIQFKGRVVDESSQPVIGAAVTVRKDKSLDGVVTDYDGCFQISVPEGTELQISCLGYVTGTVVAKASSTRVTVVIEEDKEMLEDVVIVGYGVQKKESVVGAISQVNNETLVNTGHANITQALSGQVSGLYSYQTSGQPGHDDATFQLRGYSSWNGSEPLVLVDGVERGFTNLDPNEVETISVLKDASATSVFGAKGANGVIIVTTRKGQIGKPKTHLSVNVGMEAPTMLPESFSAETILNALNLGLRNDGLYGSQHSKTEIDNYMSGKNPLRYPQNNWYDIMLRDFATSANASYGVSGGTDRVRYYVNLGYNHEGSIIKNLPGMVKNYSLNRVNYRANLDFNVTKTTVLTARFGGFSRVVTRPGATGETLFTNMYNASTIQYPAFFPADIMEKYPDLDYPGLVEFRRAGTSGLGVTYAHPVNTVADGDFAQSTRSNLALDLELNQKLDFITKGLSINGKVSYTTEFSRNSQSASMSYPNYYLNWDTIENGSGNPWSSSIVTTDVYYPDPYKISKSTSPSSMTANFYAEASVHYDRKFGNHDVSVLGLTHIRNYVADASYPTRSRAYVGRLNYNYKGKYLLEGNLGITGSEQFSPKNRYGVFPSVAVGWYISKEEFWKNAMPWWSTFKLRYSDGIVGSDKASAQWLYFSTYTRSDTSITQGKVANDTARWEKAHKQNIGLELGWFKDNLMLDVELFNEDRTDILVTPLTTLFVVTSYKDVNAGAITKHGMEVELKWRNTTSSGFFYEIGGMVGLNENRILAYPDSPYAPDYQKRVGKAYGSSSTGESLVDDRFFGTIDEKHGYPGGNDSNSQGRDYKFLDYNGNGKIDIDDRHPVFGSNIPPVTYSGHVKLAWKGLSFDALISGARGKYTCLEDVYYIEFYKGDFIYHANSANYWTPTNPSADHASLSMMDGAILTFGRSDSVGTNCDIIDILWKKADFLSIKDVRLAYKFNKLPFVKKIGLDGLTVTLTGNNLYTFTPLKDADPEINDLQNSYYPIMRTLRLGLGVDF